MFLVDTTTSVAVGAAIGSGAIALALAVLVVVFLVRPRSRREPDAEVAGMLRDSDQRFEEMIEDLARELERAQDDMRRGRRIAGLASAIDLDVLAERVLHSALELPGVDAAALAVSRPDEEPLLATAAMTREETERHPLPPARAGGRRAATIAYRYESSAKPADPRIGGGLTVPLRSADATVGTLAVFWRGQGRKASDQQLAALDDLAAGAGPAVENAIRFRDASRLADLDALTGLHNRRYFHDTLARECSRAMRYGRQLGLLVFDVDDFKPINDRLGHLAADTVLAKLAERVRSVLRSSDIACRVGGDEFAVILPESGLADAEQLYRRLEFAAGNAATGPVDRLRLSAGVAELRPSDDPATFFERTDEALFRAKQAGKGRAMAAG